MAKTKDLRAGLIGQKFMGRAHSNALTLMTRFLVSSAPGNGDCIGYGLRREGPNVNGLFRWDHKDDSRVVVAPDPATYLAWTLDEVV